MNKSIQNSKYFKITNNKSESDYSLKAEIGLKKQDMYSLGFLEQSKDNINQLRDLNRDRTFTYHDTNYSTTFQRMWNKTKMRLGLNSVNLVSANQGTASFTNLNLTNGNYSGMANGYSAMTSLSKNKLFI